MRSGSRVEVRQCTAERSQGVLADAKRESCRIATIYRSEKPMGMYYTSLLTVCGQDPARKVSENKYDIYHCCMYSEEILMMDRGTVRYMSSFIPKIILGK